MDIQLADHVLYTELDGEAVLLNLKTGYYYTLNEVGTHLWALLAEHASFDSIIEEMLGSYAVEQDELERDVLEIIADFREHGLVEDDS